MPPSTTGQTVALSLSADDTLEPVAGLRTCVNLASRTPLDCLRPARSQGRQARQMVGIAFSVRLWTGYALTAGRRGGRFLSSGTRRVRRGRALHPVASRSDAARSVATGQKRPPG